MFQRIVGRFSFLAILGILVHLASALPQCRLVAQAAPSNGVATFTPSTLSFGAVQLDATSATMQISLSNTGTGPLGSIALSVTNTDYTITNNTCPATLAANSAPCTITLSFTPSFEAPDPGGLVVTDDGATGTTTALLSGNGVTTVYVLPFEIFYDGQAVGSTSAPQTATFTNAADSPASITSVTNVGNAAGDFLLNSACGATVGAESNCTIGVTFKPTTTGPRTADLTVATSTPAGPFVAHLTGNGAIRHLPGFTANVLLPNDDGSSAEVPLPFAVNFFGTTFNSLFVNNNGNVTFVQALSEFTPTGLNSDNGGIPIIAAYWADVDTRGATEGSEEAPTIPSAVVSYGVDTVNGHPAFGVDYENTGYYDTHTDKLNSFQLILIDRSDTGIAGAFDIEFDYDKVQWEAGDASNGIDGLCSAQTEGCVSAAVGYSNGTGTTGTNFQLPGSFVPGALLDNGPAATALIQQAMGGTMPGRTTFAVRNGTVQSADVSLTMTQSASTVAPGSNLTYTLTAANLGPNDTTNVIVTEVLPAMTTLVSATPSQGSACTGTTTLTCNLGSVANAAQATLTIVVTIAANATGTVTNSASVVSDLPDPNMANNTATISATVGAATNFTLTVAEAGTGTGTVTSAPTGINCGTACAANFASGTMVTLTAVPATGSTFAGWSGACTGTGACVVMVTAAAAVTATFTAANTFALTVTKAGTGTGTVTSAPTGINCGTACAANFASGTMVTLTQVAATGSTFAGWSGACTGTGACVVTVTAAAAVTATFTAANTFAVTVTKAGTGTGTVTSAPAGINCGTACAANFASGTMVTLTAAPATGSTFTGWGAGPCEGTGTCTFTIGAATAVTANFTASVNNFTLTVTEAGNGTGTVTSAPAGIICPETCSASFASGTQVTLTQSAADGSVFAGWGGACTGIGACVVTVTAATAVTATFNSTTNNPVTITVPSGGSTTGTTSPGGTTYFGLIITCAAGQMGTVTLSATSSTNLISVNLIPNTVVCPGGSQQAVQLQTFCQGTTVTTGSVPGGFGGGAGGGGGIGLVLATMMLGGFGFMFRRERRDRRVTVAFAMVLIMVAMGIGACGSLPKSPTGQATPPGTYFISLTTSLNGRTQTLPNFLTLVVK
jgi:uncharacterized repeat protein (TIGR01451 family)